MSKKNTSASWYLILIAAFVVSCQDLKVYDPTTYDQSNPLSIESAKEIINSKGAYGKNPIWELAENVTKNNITYLHVPVTVENDLIPAISKEDGTVDMSIRRFSQSEMTHLFFYKDKKGVIQTEVFTYIPDDTFYSTFNLSNNRKKSLKFSGIVQIKNWENDIITSYQIKNDYIMKELVFRSQQAKLTNQQAKARPAEDACGSTQWLRCTCNTDPSYHYNCSCTVYGMDYYGCLYYPNPSTGGNQNLVTFTNGGGSIFVVSSNGGANSTAINGNNVNYPSDPGDVNIPVRQALTCFSSGSNTDDYNYSITVYVDEPAPGSGLSYTFGGGVGHVWVGFQKQNKASGATSSTSIGLYPSYVSMSGITGGVPSVTKENSSHAADVSITYAVSKDQFSNAVSGAINSSSRQYSLTDYNCTDYVYSIVDAAGLKIPKPSSYFYVTDGVNNAAYSIHSPGALGVSLRGINSSAVKKGQNPPTRNANCY